MMAFPSRSIEAMTWLASDGMASAPCKRPGSLPRWLILILFCMAVSVGCSSGGRNGVEGSVRYAGVPIAVGTITFMPVGEGGIKCGGRIENGHYQVEPQFGPVAGLHRVEIHWAKPTGKSYKNEFGEVFDVTEEGLPEKYHAKSILTRTVKSGPNVFDFELEE
jgi:hypothetical protein